MAGMKISEGKQEKNKRQPHPFVEIPGSCGHGQIDLIAQKAFKEGSQEAELVFEMADHSFNGGPSTKTLP